MQNIFIGMLLVLLNFNLDINTIRIGLIPTFLGYIFMFLGANDMTSYSNRFSKVKPLIAVMIVYSLITYFMDLFGITYQMHIALSIIIGLVLTVMSLVISHMIISGIQEIEVTRQQNLETGKLYSAWVWLAILTVAVYFLALIPSSAMIVICIIAGFIIVIYYLVVFNRTKQLFYFNNGNGQYTPPPS